MRLDRSGAVVWSRELPNPTHSSFFDAAIAVSPLGNVFLALRVACADTGCPDWGGGALSGGELLKFEPPGTLVWQRPVGGEFTGALAVDGVGSAAVAFIEAPTSTGAGIRKYRWDGARLWDVEAPAVNGSQASWAALPTRLAFDPSGNLAVGDQLAFYVLDASGRLRWSSRLEADAGVSGSCRGIGTTALGTVVATVDFSGGQVAYAGTRTDVPIYGGVFLAVAEAYGAPRFGRLVAVDAGAVGAAVDPAGRVAILTRGSACGDTLVKWNLAGDVVWRRPVAVSSGCDSTSHLVSTSVAIDASSHDVLAGGWFGGTIDLGTGPILSRGGTDDFVLDVQP